MIHRTGDLWFNDIYYNIFICINFLGKYVLDAQRARQRANGVGGEELNSENMVGLDSKDPSFTGASDGEQENQGI